MRSDIKCVVRVYTGDAVDVLLSHIFFEVPPCEQTSYNRSLTAASEQIERIVQTPNYYSTMFAFHFKSDAGENTFLQHEID